MTTPDGRQQPDTGPDGKPMDLQTLGHLAGSFVAMLIVLLVMFGVPITAEQQAAIYSLIISGWAFGSGIYAWITRGRHPRIPDPGSNPTAVGAATPANTPTLPIPTPPPVTPPPPVNPPYWSGADPTRAMHPYAPPPTYPGTYNGRYVPPAPPPTYGTPQPHPTDDTDTGRHHHRGQP